MHSPIRNIYPVGNTALLKLIHTHHHTYTHTHTHIITYIHVYLYIYHTGVGVFSKNIVSNLSTIAVVPMTPDIPLSHFTRLLTSAINSIGQRLHHYLLLFISNLLLFIVPASRLTSSLIQEELGTSALERSVCIYIYVALYNVYKLLFVCVHINVHVCIYVYVYTCRFTYTCMYI